MGPVPQPAGLKGARKPKASALFPASGNYRARLAFRVVRKGANTRLMETAKEKMKDKKSLREFLNTRVCILCYNNLTAQTKAELLAPERTLRLRQNNLTAQTKAELLALIKFDCVSRTGTNKATINVLLPLTRVPVTTKNKKAGSKWNSRNSVSG